MSTKPVEQPAEFAEGVPVPAAVVRTVEQRNAEIAAAPTPADYQREWGTYRALHTLMVEGSPAVSAGNPVPASHPYLRDSHEVDPETGRGGWGDGWVTQGVVELTGDYDAPADLVAQGQETDEKAVKDASVR